ncbi:MAG: MltA domain-containing protein [Pseudomonadota bacterium]
MPAVSYEVLDYGQLDGWRDDNFDRALQVFVDTVDLIAAPGWQGLLELARQAENARDFFESAFTPVLMSDGGQAHFTGYYEPELGASPVQDGAFQFPIYAVPPELDGNTPFLSRAQIERDGALAGRDLEIAWLDSAVERYFLQVQGSGRLRLTDGSVMRVGFAAKNGHPYTSLGKRLIQAGVFAAQEITADAIRLWASDNPGIAQTLMWQNASYVFFKQITDIQPQDGPLGTMQRPITAGRSIAVDDQVIPLGAPIWVETDGADPIRRLMIAQDTGSAIKGAQRADLFIGTGAAAGKVAGAINDTGRMVVLWPKEALQHLQGTAYA